MRFTQALSPSNMHSRFSALLWLEELHAEKEMREFSISGALLRKGAVYLHLEVLGLAEGRPNLNIGEVAFIIIVVAWFLFSKRRLTSFHFRRQSSTEETTE